MARVAAPDGQGAGFGANSWLVEEMYEQFVEDPSSVSESWREFFADYHSQAPSVAAAAATSPAVQAVVEAHRAPSDDAYTTGNGASASAPAPTPAVAPAAPAAPAPAAPAATDAAEEVEEPGTPIRGAGAAIARNMEASLAVPTATSFRNVPAKLLEVNRKVINGFRSRSGQTKISFTHLIGWAIVRAIADAVPAMKNTYVLGDDGKPRLVEHDHVNMSLAVDKEKPDGSRTLLVPVIRDCDTLDFKGFLAAYEEIIRKVNTNKLTVDDFQGANISLTNPGGIGTVQSVPRLMPGQAVIVGVGSIDYPAEFEGSDRRNLSSIGVSKVVTITASSRGPSRACSSSASTSCCSANTTSTKTCSSRSTCPTKPSSGVRTRSRSTVKRRCSPSRWPSPS